MDERKCVDANTLWLSPIIIATIDTRFIYIYIYIWDVSFKLIVSVHYQTRAHFYHRSRR